MTLFCLILCAVTAIVAAVIALYCYVRIEAVWNFAVDKSAKLALEMSDKSRDYADHFNKMYDRLRDIEERLDAIPVEDLQSKYDAEKAWNDGIQNILNYGLKKEVADE